jgi:pyruvate,orthophosphate dikinase
VTFVFAFDHAHPRPPKELAALLGGKGANLAEMTSVLGLPVPPGFTITTDACRAFLADGWPDGLDAEVAAHRGTLEQSLGRTLGDADDPLLVSVRSGAAVSMPGMMDTVLDLGLNDQTVEGLARQTDDRRFALDCYRRFIQLYGTVVLGIDAEHFATIFDDAKSGVGVESDHEVAAEVLSAVIADFRTLVERATGAPFPQDPAEQLRGAIEAVFRSWNSPRAQAYRRREAIGEDRGTAVNVQAMVFGNRDDRSGTGVAFTRDPSTGEPTPYGDFLVNAQGEDVVAGIRTTEPLAALAELFPEVHAELSTIFGRLERHFRDVLDIEFTIEQDRLWLLQTRVAKRAGVAALRIAVAMVDDPVIALTRAEAVRRITPDHLEQVVHPQFEDLDAPVIATGLPASPGAAVGRAYFSADDALDANDRGEDVILVRQETSPEDVHGMEVAEGILTSRGGLVSHAAVVARGWGKPAVCGAESIEVGPHAFVAGDVTVKEGDVISIDGTSGTVVLGSVDVTEGAVPPEFGLVLSWADEIRGDRVHVRANADNGDDARRARGHGAEGVGLARTEHLFLGDRLPLVKRLILAETAADEQAALDELVVVQQADIEDLLEAMDGLPVTVRLLDPPLHEFLPGVEDLAVAEAKGELDDAARRVLAAARDWQEQNPMLGTRGVRLGIVKSGLYTMQARAIARAVLDRRAAGGDPRVQIMIPFVVTGAELEQVRRWVVDELDAELGGDRDPAGLPVGTMIETPRAALCADQIAAHADFFSFGTNDLTQMTFGFSRDDVERRTIPRYLDDGLLSHNPFRSIDRDGVGELVRVGAERGRAARPGLEVGVCGEHGGDPDSIAFFYELGFDYVSCSPFRVPIARLALAHAVLDAGG